MTTVATSTSYDQLIKHSKETSLMGTTTSLLHWDREVNMPPKGIEYRSDQIALGARMYHEMLTDPHVNDLLDACESDSELMADPISEQQSMFAKCDTSTIEQRSCLRPLSKKRPRCRARPNTFGLVLARTMILHRSNHGLKKLSISCNERPNVMAGPKAENRGMPLPRIMNRAAPRHPLVKCSHPCESSCKRCWMN